MLGGALTVKSEVGVGSTFAVELPSGPSDGVPFAELQIDHVALDPVSRKITTRLSCRVLLVDDRRDVRHVAQHFLEEAGAVVETATDGREGIEAVKRSEQNGQPFDVILMDMQMPNMDGYAATSELRSTGCELPVIAMTADAMRGDREHCLDVGCDDYLPKPIEPFDLVEKVRCVTQDTSTAIRAARARRVKAMQTSAQ